MTIVLNISHLGLWSGIVLRILPIELMIGKIVPYMMIGAIQVVIILGLGHWVFNVPINGDLWQLAAVTFLFIAASLTLGLVISAIAMMSPGWRCLQ